MDSNFISVSDLGRRWGAVYMALYRAKKFVTIAELAELAQQDLKVVETVLKFLKDQGWVEKLADGDKWGYVPHARAVIENMDQSTSKLFPTRLM